MHGSETKRNMRLRGALTAIVTPLTADGKSIDFERLDAQIAEQARGGVAGIVVAGTTGESPTLSDREYRELCPRAVEAAKRFGLVAVVGTGSNNTAHAVELQRFAAEIGADASLSVNPYYNKPTQEGLFRHFSAVADAADLPVILYNIPGRTGVGLSISTIERLAAHPNIQAVKEASANVAFASDVAMHCPSLDVLSGDDPLTLPIASVGGVGVISVVSNVLPARVSAMCEAFLSDRWSDALEIHRELSALSSALFLETNPIPVKGAMKMLGRDSGAVRAPLTPATDATMMRLREVLTTHELL